MSRQLQLGVTLVRSAPGFDLDLSTPDAHKTAAAFGPTVTEVPEPAATLLKAWLHAAGPHRRRPRPAVRVRAARPRRSPATGAAALDRAKAVFKRHAGVPLAPKELRASLVCCRGGGLRGKAVG